MLRCRTQRMLGWDAISLPLDFLNIVWTNLRCTIYTRQGAYGTVHHWYGSTEILVRTAQHRELSSTPAWEPKK